MLVIEIVMSFNMVFKYLKYEGIMSTVTRKKRKNPNIINTLKVCPDIIFFPILGDYFIILL